MRQVILSLLWWVAKNRVRMLMGAWVIIPLLIGLATIGLLGLGAWMVLRGRDNPDEIPESHAA